MAAQPRYRLHMNDTPDAAVDVLESLLVEQGPSARSG